MRKDPVDVSYAYMQLGLAAGSSLREIGEVLEHAVAYRFAVKERVERVRRYVDFFARRALFCTPDLSFAEVKKAYHREAMRLHPDRSRGDKASEDRLKELNAAYACVEVVYREALAFDLQSEESQRALELEAREATEKENPRPRQESPAHAFGRASGEPTRRKPQAEGRKKVLGRKYRAAAIPRNIRIARLGYLPATSVIGTSFVVNKQTGQNFVYDVLMLTEDQFSRAKAYLSVPEMVGSHLQYGKFSPAYVPKDVKEVIVPEEVADQEAYAAAFFKKEFGLDG